MGKFAAVITSLCAASAAAFAPFKAAQPSTALSASLDGYTGALPPVGVFDPLGLAEKATDATLARYREAELAHGRVAMLATIGFFVGEKVEGSSFLFILKFLDLLLLILPRFLMDFGLLSLHLSELMRHLVLKLDGLTLLTVL